MHQLDCSAVTSPAAVLRFLPDPERTSGAHAYLLTKQPLLYPACDGMLTWHISVGCGCCPSHGRISRQLTCLAGLWLCVRIGVCSHQRAHACCDVIMAVA